MKYAHYDEINGKLLGWYDSEIHDTIPEPNIEVSEADWQTAIDNNYNFVNMSSNTLEFKDFRTFEELQKAKINELKQAYNTANQEDIAYMDTTFQADKNSQNLIVLVLSAGMVPKGFYWKDSSNNHISMTFKEVQGLSATILVRGQVNFNKYQDLKAQVRDTTTQVDLEKISW